MAEIIINGKTYKLSCSMHDCDNNMHSFHTTKTLQKKGVEKGCCHNCKSTFVDWERVYKKDISDIDYLENAFKLEMFRNVYWNMKKPSLDMVNKIRNKTPNQLSEQIQRKLRTTLSKPRNQNVYDGRQTSFADDLILWAQHATGTCCRKCLEQWYDIDANSELSLSDYDYLEQVVTHYINKKIQ